MPGTGADAGATENEDAVAVSGDPGVAQLCVRSSNYYSTTTSSAAGDYDVCHTAPDGSVIVNLPDGLPVTVNSVASVSTLLSTDTLGWAGVTLQVTGTWVGTVTFEASNDNTNWASAAVVNGTTASLVTTSTTPGTFYFAAQARYFRARVSAYTSGTVTGTALLRSTPLAPSVTSSVSITGTAGVQIVAGTNNIGAVQSATTFAETTASLASAATFTGTTRDLGSATAITYPTFGCQFNADQAGTAYIDNSTDGTTWVQAASQAVTASFTTPVDLNVPIRARYNRCRLVNGATAQTAFRVVSSYRD